MFLIPQNNFCSFFRSRSKVLSRWLAGLPQQLALLGLRNPELSNQLIDIIHSAASRSNKELLQSLQATADQIYGKTLLYSILIFFFHHFLGKLQYMGNSSVRWMWSVCCGGGDQSLTVKAKRNDVSFPKGWQNG